MELGTSTRSELFLLAVAGTSVLAGKNLWAALSGAALSTSSSSEEGRSASLSDLSGGDTSAGSLMAAGEIGAMLEFNSLARAVCLRLDRKRRPII